MGKSQQQQPDASTSVGQGQSAASLTASKLDQTQTQVSADSGTIAAAGATTVGDMADAGIDLSEEAFPAGADEAGARVLCAWLNANVATSFIEVE